jgi:alpha-tubulin suppressor-like RCC1 family protein
LPVFSKRKAAPLLFAGLALSFACNSAETLMSGVLGNGKTPRMIEGAISAGWTHTCVLTGAGKVKCWGSNEFGQLGDGTTENRNTPVDVAGLPEGIKSVSADFQHSCTLTAEGGVKCWGNNYFGQLGDGTFENRNAPVSVLYLPGD